jgi:hypothetical protein
VKLKVCPYRNKIKIHNHSNYNIFIFLDSKIEHVVTSKDTSNENKINTGITFFCILYVDYLW